MFLPKRKYLKIRRDESWKPNIDILTDFYFINISPTLYRENFKQGHTVTAYLETPCWLEATLFIINSTKVNPARVQKCSIRKCKMFSSDIYGNKVSTPWNIPLYH